MRSICNLALVGFVLVFGCDRQASQRSSTSTDSDGGATIDKVFDNHNVTAQELTLSTDELKQRLAEAEEWNDLTLDEIATGQYEGKAKSPSGELLNVEVRQTAEGIYARWTNADNTQGGHSAIVW